MSVEIDAVIQTKIESIEQQILQIQQQEKNRIDDMVVKQHLQKCLLRLDSLDVQ